MAKSKKKRNTKSTANSWDICKIVEQMDENDVEDEYDEIAVSDSDDETDFDDEINSEDEAESEDGSELTYFVDENNLVLIEVDGDGDDSLEDIYNEIQNYGEDTEDE